MAAEKDLVQSISGLKAAIVAILKRHASMIAVGTLQSLAERPEPPHGGSGPRASSSRAWRNSPTRSDSCG